MTEVIATNNSDIIQIKYKEKSTFSSSTLLEKRAYLMNTYVPELSIHNSSVTQSVVTQTVDRIVFKDGFVQFEYAYDRKDRPGGEINSLTSIPRITGLTVYNKNNEIIKKVLIDNNYYFNRSPSSLLYNEFYHQPIPSFQLKSLKLAGVKFLNKNNLLLSKYSFDYDTTLLPTKNSGAIDFWGYYNGKIASTLLPTPKIVGVYTPDSFDYAKRDTDFNFMKASTLTKITYPTGGYTIYDYEPNYFLTKHQQNGMALYQGQISAYALKNDINCSEGQNLVTSPHTIMEFPIINDTEGLIDFNVFFLIIIVLEIFYQLQK